MVCLPLLFTRGEIRHSLEVAKRSLDLAERSDHDALQCAAHRRLGESLLFQGQFAAARTHLELSDSFFIEADAQKLATLGAILAFRNNCLGIFAPGLS